MEHLGGLTQLDELAVTHARVSDAGLKHVEGLFRLRSLDLSGTQVTDAGLEHLKQADAASWVGSLETRG